MPKRNKILSKPFLETLFWKQNKHHRHGVVLPEKDRKVLFSFQSTENIML